MTANLSSGNVLYGSKATEALDKYIRGLEKKQTFCLSKKRISIRIKVAKALRTATLQ